MRRKKLKKSKFKKYKGMTYNEDNMAILAAILDRTNRHVYDKNLAAEINGMYKPEILSIPAHVGVGKSHIHHELMMHRFNHGGAIVVHHEETPESVLDKFRKAGLKTVGITNPNKFNFDHLLKDFGPRGEEQEKSEE